MNGHDDLRPSEDDFEEYAQAAGASLRRPAPADGLHQVRAVRRRQRVQRAAAGGAAVALLAVAGAVLVLRDRDDTSITTTPDTTQPSVTPTGPTTQPSSPTDPSGPTVPPTTQSGGVTTSAPPPSTDPPIPADSGLAAPLSDAARAWIDARAADGLSQVQITKGEGTAAVLIAAWHPTEARYASAVMLPDGRVVDTPAGVTAQPFGFEMYSVGTQPVLVSTIADTSVALWRLDPATGEWANGPDLGLGPLQSESLVQSGLAIKVVNGSLLVAHDTYVLDADGTMSPAPDRRGVVVHPDLSVTPIAAPPDGVPMTWTLATGTKALLLFAPNGGSENLAPIGGRWAYDVESNSWSRLTDPEWWPCTDRCDWVGPFEMGDEYLAVATYDGVLVRLPDSSIGRYDAVADRWTRLDNSPFQLPLPRTLAMGDQVLVAPMRGFSNDYGLVGVVDMRTGTWTFHKIEFPPDLQALIDTWVDATWEIRGDGNVAMLAPSQAQRGTTRDPIAVYDPATRTWSAPTADDIAVWDRFPTIFGTENF
jgi:hypothetical protein